MAVTSLWRIKGAVNKVIVYAENPDKTIINCENIETKLDTRRPENVLNAVLDYTERGTATEQKRLVSGINCDPGKADKQMMKVKNDFGKTGGTVAYHGYQSFSEGELDAETAHLIGCRLAEELWGDRYQVVVATHVDKQSHIHNHFVINTVAFTDGKKFHRTNQDYRDMQNLSDKLCKEYGLKTIRIPENNRKNYVEYRAEKNGQLTKNEIIRKDLDECTTDEEKKLYDVLIHEDVPYAWQMLLSMFTGMRMGEINALTRDDINLNFKIITVEKTISRDLQGHPSISENPKTEAGRRNIPISETAMPIVKEILEYSDDGDYLFMKNGKLITTSMVNMQLHRVFDSHDILDPHVKGKVSLHSLRHTFATRCIEAGMQPIVLQKLLGHSDIKVTMNTYCDAFESYKRENLNIADEYMAKMGFGEYPGVPVKIEA